MSVINKIKNIMGKGKLEIPLDEYNRIQDIIKNHEKNIAKLNIKCDNLKEKIACYNDALYYLNQVSIFDRIFHWKRIMSYANEISKIGVTMKVK